MRVYTKLLLSLLLLLSLGQLRVEALEIPDEYVPKLNGTLRTRYEWATIDGDQRFQVRNARIALNGKLMPSVTYRAEVDLCDRGSVKCLDVWGRVDLSKHLSVQLGQMRMPFTMGSYRAPHQYYFANRATTDKQAGSPREVGAKLIYNLGRLPLSIEGGVFNTSAITNHNVWQKHLGYAGKIRYIIDKQFTILVSAQSLCPDSVRINHLSGALSWHTDRWLIEGEYIYRHPTHHRFEPSHAYCFMADYGMPVKVGGFNRLSFQGRFDGMTATWDGKSEMEAAARNRVTVGLTLSYVKGGKRCDMRLNYEQCYFHHDYTPVPDEGNRLVAELVVRF